MATTTPAAPGAYDWISQIISGVGNLATSPGDLSAAQRASQMADPWGPQRGQYQDRLNAYMADPANSTATAGNHAGIQGALARMNGLLDDPSSLEKQPGYQWGLNQALEAVNRGAGSSGLLNSGNRLTALQDRGQGYAQGWQQQIWNELLGNANANINAGQEGLQAQGQGFNQLGQLAGVNAGSPVAAAQALLNGRQQFSNSIGTGLGGITNGLTGAFASPAMQAIIRQLSGGSGWGGATPGGANGSWDVNPVTGGGANDQWDINQIIGGGGSNGSWDVPGVEPPLPDDWSWLTGG